LPGLALAIDTTGSWNGTSQVSTFGIPNTQTYGQTIVAEGTGTLISFTFYIKGATTLAFRGHVYAWDGTKATGPSLYDSAPVSTTNSSIFEEVTFATNLSLTIGQAYVIFVSSSEDNGGHSGTAVFGLVANPYANGTFVFRNNGTDTSQWTGGSWSSFSSDLAFKADFVPNASGSSVPTLSEGGLVLLCGALLAAGYRVLTPKSQALPQA